MKKPIKITIISLGSLLALLLIVAIVAVNVVFSPKRLTPIVQKYANEFLTCKAEIGEVDLSLFGSFPEVSLRLNNVVLVNPVEDAQSDTLARVDKLYCSLDLMELVNNKKVDVTGFTFYGGEANLFVAKDGTTNFDIVKPSEPETEESEPMKLDKMSLSNVSVDNVNVSYIDDKLGMTFDAFDLMLTLSSKANILSMSGDVNVGNFGVEHLCYKDSVNTGMLDNLALNDVALTTDGKNVAVKFDLLTIADQLYTLTGETPITARISNMRVKDVDGAWHDQRPVFAGVTTFDSAAVVMGTEGKQMHINVDQSTIDMPVTSTPERWTTTGVFSLNNLNIVDDHDGVLVKELDIDSRFVASTNAEFKDFIITDMVTKAGGQIVEASAHVELPDSTLIKADLKTRVKSTTVGELLALVPKSYKSALKGIDVEAKLDDADVAAKCEIKNGAFSLSHLAVTSKVHKMDYAEGKAMAAKIDDLDVEVAYPSGAKKCEIEVKGKLLGLHYEQRDSSTLIADIPAAALTALMPYDVIDGKLPKADATIEIGKINVVLDDTVKVALDKVGGKALLDMRSKKDFIALNLDITSSKIEAAIAQSLKSQLSNVSFIGSAVYDDKQPEILDMLNPNMAIKMQSGKLEIAELPYAVNISALDGVLTKDKVSLNKLQMALGNSNLGIKGIVENVNDWLKDRALLEANINLHSDIVDADQIMEIASGFGVSDEDLDAESSTDKDHATAAEADPFIVPKNIKVLVNTDVKQVTAQGNIFENLKGKLACNDGVLVFEEMGFTSKAAKMQLSAMYKSPRRNNLFVEWNFHLVDIDIAEMIRIVPDIDTIVPMLSSFAGKAQFHLVGETALFADYTPKMSTLKAAASIEGTDLVVMDNETFRTVKKYLFKESTPNKIDSLSVEMVIGRKKATVYPMLISMDKYQAVVSGFHNLTDAMPFNYHISITKCPIVGGHVGLDIIGDLEKPEDFSFKLVGCKYANLYRPDKQNVTQEQILHLKHQISSQLRDMVK